MEKYYDCDADKVNVINFKSPYKTYMSKNSDNKKKLMVNRLITRNCRKECKRILNESK